MFKKCYSTLAEAYNILKEHYLINVQTDRFKHCELRSFDYYLDKYKTIQ